MFPARMVERIHKSVLAARFITLLCLGMNPDLVADNFGSLH